MKPPSRVLRSMTHPILHGGILFANHGSCPHCGLLRCGCQTLALNRRGFA